MVISFREERNSWEDISRQLKGSNHIILCGGYEGSNYYFDGNIRYLNCNDFYDELPEKVIRGLLVIH